jgi:hypothetical protein
LFGIWRATIMRLLTLVSWCSRENYCSSYRTQRWYYWS